MLIFYILSCIYYTVLKLFFLGGEPALSLTYDIHIITTNLIQWFVYLLIHLIVANLYTDFMFSIAITITFTIAIVLSIFTIAIVIAIFLLLKVQTIDGNTEIR